LNPQSKKDFMKARTVARAGAHHLSTNCNNEKGTEAAAKTRFEKPQKGDFNWWMEDNNDNKEEE